MFHPDTLDDQSSILVANRDTGHNLLMGRYVNPRQFRQECRSGGRAPNLLDWSPVLATTYAGIYTCHTLAWMITELKSDSFRTFPNACPHKLLRNPLQTLVSCSDGRPTVHGMVLVGSGEPNPHRL